MKRVLAVGSLLLVGGLISACGTTPTTSSTTTNISDAAQIAIAMQPDESPNWFFPVLSATAYSTLNLQVDSLMYKPLLDITGTDSIDYNRSLAKSVTWNAAGTQFVIHLNPKYHWSDGRPVTAKDVVFAWDIMKAASSGASNLPWSYGGAGIGGVPTDWASVRAQNARTVVVNVTKPVNQQWFLRNGLGQLYPVPAFVWDKYPNNAAQELKFILGVANSPTAPEYRVVDGPYKFSAMEANRYWSLVANSSYDGHKATIHKVTFQYETSSASEFAALKNGTVTYGYLPYSLWKERHNLGSDKMSTEYVFGFNFMPINFNSAAPGGIGLAFQQLYVRQALQMGIDQVGISKTLFHGQAVPEDSPIPAKPSTIFYDPALKKPLYPYDIARGQQLLEKHGWKLVKGVMTKNGRRLAFTLVYLSGSNTEANIVQLLKVDWAKEGIQVSLEAEPFDTVIADINQVQASKWAMALVGPGWSYEPDYYPSGGGLFATGSGANYGGYSSGTMNGLIQKTYLPGSQAAALQRLDAYQQYAAQDLPVLWMPLQPTFVVYAGGLHGVLSTMDPVSDLLAINRWTLSH